MTRPLRYTPLQELHHYYGPVRQLTGQPDLKACLADHQQPGISRVSLLTFRTGAADQAHVTSMPDTAWPISGHPPGSSRDTRHHPGSDVVCLCFDTSAVIRLRSSSWSPP